MKIFKKISWFFQRTFGKESDIDKAIAALKRHGSRNEFLCLIHEHYDGSFNLKKVLKVLDKKEVREEFKKETKWGINNRWKGDCEEAITYIPPHNISDFKSRYYGYVELKLIHLRIAKKYES